MTQLIIYIGTTVIALSSGFGAYIYATHQLHSSGFVVGLVATLMPWYLSQFFSYTMMSMLVYIQQKKKELDRETDNFFD